ncbi:MAG: PKD domain-containing protein [Candidatus Methanomethylophilaceae archaeon]|jgi:PKD repeat protein|nr:PKD domain-containing protein [Candidatus Methanomethylophilaceae archaeon]
MNAKLLALLAVFAMVAAAVAIMPAASAAGEEDTEEEELSADVTIDELRVKFTNTSSDALYIVWDFGDGTVLDGRWEHYRGQTLTDPDMAEGWAAYSELLSGHGGDINRPVHAYAENGTYKMSITAINPIGWEHGGQTYTAENYVSTAEFDGGLFSDSKLAKDIGSHDVKQYVIKIDASESGDGFNWLPYILIAIGAIVAVVGFRFHPAFIVAGVAIAAVGAVWALGWIDLGVSL